MTPRPPRLVCHGCGTVVPASDPLVFACPSARDGDDVDHVLEPDLDLEDAAFPVDGEADGACESPFLRYGPLLHVVREARARGRSDAEVEDAVRRLDDRVAAVDGRGFVETPFLRADGVPGVPSLLVKIEAGGVAGSHKARHLFPVALHLDLAGAPRSRPLAIASCGNAALAAAVVARAAERPLRVFVPDDAPPSVTARLGALGAEVNRVRRDDGEGPAGDPCVHAFRRAVRDGAVPFSVQGPENGRVVEGARTIAWEIVSAVRRGVAPLPEHVVVQVGGGALLSAVASGFAIARAVGAVERIPVFHAVQSAGGAPFVEACRRLAEGGPGAAAAAARQRSSAMRPWPVAPRSIARGILDDETYDWFVGARAVLEGGGRALTVTDDEIVAATALARELSPAPVCETGAAGLAGARRLAADGVLSADGPVAVLFTGRSR
ncbi:MAG: pyridoxal-phosphate dependent enzyme [Planctomycetota bacterium JB042]